MMRIALLLLSATTLYADEPAKPEETPGKLTERIVDKSDEAGKRLAEKQTGKDTQELQREIRDALDELIKKAQQPPPSSGGGGGGMGDPSNSGGGGGGGGASQGGDSQEGGGAGSSKSQKLAPGDGGSSSRPNRKPRPEPGSGNAGKEPKAGPEPSPKKEPGDGKSNPMGGGKDTGAGGPGGSGTPPKPTPTNPRVPDVYKDVWGQLPDRVRKEMDQYYRSEFMPKYSEMLKLYFSALAERGEKAGGK